VFYIFTNIVFRDALYKDSKTNIHYKRELKMKNPFVYAENNTGNF